MLPGILAILLFLAIATGWAYALSSMGAIDAVWSDEPARAKIRLIDFFALFAVLQAPLLVTSIAVRSHAVGLAVAIVIGLLLTALFAGMWWRGVSALTSLEIEDWRRRMLCLAVLLPTSLVGGVVALPVAVFMPVYLVMGGEELWLRFTAGLSLAIVGGLVGLGAQWVVAETSVSPSLDDGETDNESD
ncbi:MAG: hypothetical protein ACR2NU_00100 [Aeoliella sp.]